MCPRLNRSDTPCGTRLLRERSILTSSLRHFSNSEEIPAVLSTQPPCRLNLGTERTYNCLVSDKFSRSAPLCAKRPLDGPGGAPTPLYILYPDAIPARISRMAGHLGEIPHTVGMLELGMSFSILLTGAATLQTWNYFRTFKADIPGNKILVAFVYVVDTSHTILLVHGCYTNSVLQFGDHDKVRVMLWSIKLSALINGVVAFIVQGYYSLRLHRLTSWRLVPLICATLSTARFALNIAKVATIYGTGHWQVVASREFRWQMIAMLVAGAAADISLAAALCFALLRMRSGLVSSDLLVYLLVSFASGSGALTSAASLSECIVYPSTNDLAFLIPFSIVAKLYNNSLLASLNERSYIRKEERRVNISLELSSRLLHTTSRLK